MKGSKMKNSKVKGFKMRKISVKRMVSILLILAMMVTGLAACAKDSENGGGDKDSAQGESGAQESVSATVADFGTEPQKVNPDEIVLTAGDYEMPASELFYYYYSAKKTFEMYYGMTDWSQQVYDGYSYGDYLKSQVESQALNIAYLMGKAGELGIELTEEEKTKAAEEVKTVAESLTEEEKSTYGFNEENLGKVNEHMLIANKVVEKLQQDAQAALTEEEKANCKYRKIQHILISTEMEKASGETTGGEGESAQSEETEDTAAEAEYKASQKKLAEEVLEKAKAGEDFETLANEYTADSGVSYSINAQGQTPEGATMVTEFAEAANALKEGEISGLVETQFGYHIIKCVTENDEEASAQAEENMAYTNISNVYSQWLQSTEYTFSDLWKNYVIINPEAADSGESGAESDAADTTADSTADSTAESDAADSAAQSSAESDNAADDTAQDSTESGSGEN